VHTHTFSHYSCKCSSSSSETAVNGSSSTPSQESLSNLRPSVRGEGACVMRFEGEGNVGASDCCCCCVELMTRSG
jgi:hypothetical protein